MNKDTVYDKPPLSKRVERELELCLKDFAVHQAANLPPKEKLLKQLQEINNGH